MRPHDRCPFVPGSGRVPGVWAGRDPELSDAALAIARRRNGVYDRGRVVLGEYGIGKSVLVNRIAVDAAAAGDWVLPAIRLPVDADPVPLLAAALHDVVRSTALDRRLGAGGRRLLSRIEEVSLPVVGGGIALRSPAPDDVGYRAVHDLARDIAILAAEQDRVLLVRVDEIQNASVPGLSQLLTIVGDLLEATTEERDAAGVTHARHLPVLFYLSGLPDFRRLAAQAGATFARRLKTFDLEPLEEVELRTALVPFTTKGWEVATVDGTTRVFMEPGVVDHLASIPHGDPFLFQLAGEAAWQAGDGDVITTAEARTGWRLVRREVSAYVDGRLEGVSDLQMRYLRAAAGMEDDVRTGDAVAVAMGRGSAADVASTAQALDRTHRLIRREAGMIRFRSPAVRAWLAGGWP